MENRAIIWWGDSNGKGVYYDEARGRYAILRENCLRLMEKEGGLPVRNHSVMGRTAAECLAAIGGDEMIPGGTAVFAFGGNDSDMDWRLVASEPDRDHPARSSIPEFYASLCGLVNAARRGGMTPILVTPVPLDGEKYFRWVSQGLDAKAILQYLGGDPHMMYRWQEQYAAAVRDAAREDDAELLDLRSAFLQDRRFRQYYCLDGIHLNEEGHRKMFGWLFGEWQKRFGWREEDSAC